MREHDAQAWILFACACLTRNGNQKLAAKTADEMLGEFKERFGGCSVCKRLGGVGTIKCGTCRGTGDKI